MIQIYQKQYLRKHLIRIKPMANTILLRPNPGNSFKMVLLQIGQVSEDPPVVTKGITRSMGNTRGVGGGGGGGGDHLLDAPTCIYDDGLAPTMNLALTWAELQWFLKTQAGCKLPFRLEIDELVKFPERSFTQIIDLQNPEAKFDKTKMFRHTLNLTPQFVGEELTLNSEMGNPNDFTYPALAREVKANAKPKITFMLLTAAKFNELLDSGELNNVMKAQAEFNDGSFTWHLDDTDEYWLCSEKTNFELNTECCWYDQPTFVFEGAVEGGVLQGPITPGEKPVVRVHRKTVVAAGGQSTTWKYCMKADSRHALPLVKINGKQLTQVWAHEFTMCFGPQEVEEVRKVYNLEETCPICMDSYRQFSVLACGHAVCATCKDNVVQMRNNVTCPFCRDEGSASDIVTVDLTGD
jgi:hypothetical protein